MSEATPLVAVLDASVLYSAPLRHLLLALAIVGAFQARWTNKIQDEWTISLLRDRPDLNAERIARTRQLMDDHIDDALVIGYEPLIPGLTLPDPNDRHVLAAAIHSGADVIVTLNLRDFPAGTLDSHHVKARHPDDFILSLLERGRDLVLAAMRAHRHDLKNPTKPPSEYLATLEAQGLVKTVIAIGEDEASL